VATLGFRVCAAHRFGAMEKSRGHGAYRRRLEAFSTRVRRGVADSSVMPNLRLTVSMLSSD